MQDDSQAFAKEQQTAQFAQEKYMFGESKALQLAMQRISENGANRRAGASNSIAQQQLDYQISADKQDRADLKNTNAFNFGIQSKQQDPYYNANAKTSNWWDAFTPWDSANEKAININKDIYQMSGQYAGMPQNNINLNNNSIYGNKTWGYQGIDGGANALIQGTYLDAQAAKDMYMNLFGTQYAY
jgi:hypothetical protein